MQEKCYHCDQCEFKAKTKNELYKHKFYIHDRPNRITCTMCGFAATTQPILEKHMKNHKVWSSKQVSQQKVSQCKFYDKCRKFPVYGYKQYEV